MGWTGADGFSIEAVTTRTGPVLPERVPASRVSSPQSPVPLGANGFSLLEVLVALALFAVIATLAWGGLDSLARSRQILAEQTGLLTDVQRAIGRLERDLRQAVSRPVRIEDGSRRPALLGGAEGVELTRLALPGGWQSPQPALERLAWRCRDDTLQRLRWPTLDRAGTTVAEIEDVLTGVSDCRWRYLGRTGPLTQWPGPDAIVLPRAIELRFARTGEGEYRRVLELPANGGQWQ